MGGGWHTAGGQPTARGIDFMGASKGLGDEGAILAMSRPITESEFASDGLSFSEADEVVVSTSLSPMTELTLSPGSFISEELRSLGARVRAQDGERTFRCIGFASALPGEGKTTLALGLATALASKPGRRVLLVEGDVRKPALHRYLGLAPASGLSEWLASNEPEIRTRHLTPLGFSLLEAGVEPMENPEELGSSRMSHLFAAARRSFDYVILDCPPLLPVADAVLMQDLVDGFLLVVRSRRSPIEAIQRAISSLKPGRVRGLVLNGQHDLLPSYSRYAYPHYDKYGYGQAYGRKPERR
jgi:succinoglycan biosynthesis transport protein ExoP